MDEKSPALPQGQAPQGQAPQERMPQGQRLILAGQRLHPGVPLYNQAFAFRVAGELDPEAFARAFDRLTEQCEALRTVIEDGADGKPEPRALDTASVAFELPVVDLAAEPDPDAAAEALLRERSALPFDLRRRTFDTLLIRRGGDRWTWYFCQHHGVTDAWSVQVIFRRLGELYQSRIDAGHGEPSAPLPPYAAFVEAEKRSRENTPEAVTQHWRHRAESDLRPPALYGRRPQTTAGRRLDVSLGPERSEALKTLARRPETGALSLELGLFNLFATLLLAFQHRTGGARRITLGAPFHNRADAVLAEVPGLLIEVFPLGPVDVDGGDSFVDLLGRARTASVEFLMNAGAGRSDARQNRTFHTLLNFIRGTFGDFAGLPTRTEWLYPGHHDKEHALRLHVHDFDDTGELHLQFDLDEGVFADLGPERAVGHFLRLLDALVEDWERPVGTVPLLADDELAEQEQVLRSPAVEGDQETVVDVFRRQAADRPDAPAVVCGSTTWTYGELAERVDDLAAELRRLGVGPGSFVGLRLGRSPEAVIAMAAVPRTGAAYVPLDPAWPEERLAFVIEDAGIERVLTAGALVSGQTWKPPDGVDVHALSDGRLIHRTGGTDPAPAPKDPEPSDTAYVLYTSGSTGRPKGVVVSHRALAAYVSWARQRYDVGHPPSYPLFSPLTFDLTVTSVWVPLTAGGRIVVYPEGDGRADLALLQVVADGAVDVVKLTPSHLGLLTAPAPRDGARRVSRLIFGGEALTRDAALRARELFGPGVHIHNEYGPTEATVGCIEHLFDPERDAGPSVPVGRPIAGARVRLLDEHGGSVPVGVAGELYLGGDGLAEGYLNRPELTAERFLPDSQYPETRLYRTGDLARLVRVGGELVLDYLGRADDQLKVRGVRVEPGEIEAVLAEHPDVVAAAVALTAPAAAEERSPQALFHCRVCGLASDFPGVDYDDDGVCNHCRTFAEVRPQVETYFRRPEDLRRLLDPVRKRREQDGSSGYDCLALLSGGKDSTYAVCRLVDMGYRVLAFTLDNGFLSDQAKDNIRRVVEALGVDHVWGSTPAMNQIFADSLERFSNVCQGCFKTLYTLSFSAARAEGIPFIVTGLSRGQLFETRLTPELFGDLGFDPEQIDRTVLEARKAYHRSDDAVSRLLDVAPLRRDAAFEEVEFLDFYRYEDVPLDHLLAYLEERVPWIRPTDTGRSTNCLINDLGIWVHRRERGFHNYSLPYSWDVRMGHKTREEALAELDDELDRQAVEAMRAAVGYKLKEDAAEGTSAGGRLVAAVVPRDGHRPEPAELRTFLEGRLPDYMVPTRVVVLDALPLTPNGKVDRKALLEKIEAAGPGAAPRGDGEPVPPRTALERTLARIWGELLGVEGVGVNDDFYRLGGDSILAIRIAARCRREGLSLDPAQIFDAPTVAGTARLLEGLVGSPCEAQADDEPHGPAERVPSQLWCLEHLPSLGDAWSQALTVQVPDNLDAERLEEALAEVTRRHDALRLRFFESDDGARASERWASECLAEVRPRLRILDPGTVEGAARELAEGLDAGEAPLWTAGLERPGGVERRLVLVAHHLVIDALSWPLLLDDLASAYDDPEAPSAPAPSFRARARALVAAVPDARAELDHWLSVLGEPSAETSPEPDAEPSKLDIAEAALDSDLTDRLVRKRSTGRSRAEAAVVAAVASTLGELTGQSRPVFFLEGHGREALATGPAPEGIVGWLGCLYPVAVTLDAGDEAARTLTAAERALGAVPRGGLGYGLLRRLDPEAGPRLAAAERSLAGPSLLVNFLGRADALVPRGSLFRFDRPLELVRGERVKRPFAIEVDAWIEDGRLRARVTVDPGSAGLDAETLARTFRQHLVRTVDGDKSTEPRAGDFPLAGLDKAKMGKLAAALGKKKSPR